MCCCCFFYIGDLGIPAPADYFAVSEVFTFSMTVDRECVNVTLIEDDILEEPENLLLDLDTDDPMVILSPEQAEVIINDTSRKHTTMHWRDSIGLSSMLNYKG